MAYHQLGDFSQAIEYHKQDLSIAKELGDRAGEGRIYNTVGVASYKLGDFNKPGDWAVEGDACFNLSEAYYKLGDFRQAIEYSKQRLSIAKELGDRADEGTAYHDLGAAYLQLGDFRQAIAYTKQHCSIAKELGQRADEGSAYNQLAWAYLKLGDFNQVIVYSKQHLSIAKELGHRVGEGSAYDTNCLAYFLGGYSSQTIQCPVTHSIAKELGDQDGEGSAYNKLCIAYLQLGDLKQAIEYGKQHVSIAKELGHRAGEGLAYNNLGAVYLALNDFNQAIKYCKQHLSSANELGDRESKGLAYVHLGLVYLRLGDFNQAIAYAEQCLDIARETLVRLSALKVVGTSSCLMGKLFKAMQFFQDYLNVAKHAGDRRSEAHAFALIGLVYVQGADFKQAMVYLKKALTMAKDLRDPATEALAYQGLMEFFLRQGDFERAIEYNKKFIITCQELIGEEALRWCSATSGFTYERFGDLHQAVDCYQRSVKFLNELRVLQADDALKITFRDAHQRIYQSLCRTLIKLEKFDEALCAADQGRAEALLDLIKLRYGSQLAVSGSVQAKPGISEMVTNISGPTLFVALQGNAVNLWVIGKDGNVQFTKKEVKYLLGDATDYLNCLRKKTYKEIRGRFRVICENRTLDGSSTEQELPPAEERGEETGNPLQSDESPLRLFHECIISPISDLIEDGELVVVPDGPLCLAPFAAFLDSESKYLSESMRIRILPSLMCMKLIDASPKEYHNKSGALLVGNPCLKDFTTLFGENKYLPLPCAEKEVEMIGNMLGIHPLTGKEATKAEVLKRIGSVVLVHIAAHGKIETGEIALAPNPQRKYRRPEEQDFRLTISDVQAAKLRAKLVVLSCCHSAQGKVSSEGVVGIARAFLGAGARSVVVALWSIDDEATMEFMRSFYQHLKDGNSASVSLNRAMKCLRESEDFNAPRFWAPFVLIGDDVTIDFKEINNES